MSDVFNLRTARKTRARIAAQAQAATNRAAFGRTKAEKARDAASAARLAAVLDGAKRGE